MTRPQNEWEEHTDSDFVEEVAHADVPAGVDADVAYLLEMDETDIAECEERQTAGLLTPSEVAFRVLKRLNAELIGLQLSEGGGLWLHPIDRLTLTAEAYHEVAQLVREKLPPLETYGKR